MPFSIQQKRVPGLFEDLCLEVRQAHISPRRVLPVCLRRGTFKAALAHPHNYNSYLDDVSTWPYDPWGYLKRKLPFIEQPRVQLTGPGPVIGSERHR